VPASRFRISDKQLKLGMRAMAASVIGWQRDHRRDQRQRCSRLTFTASGVS
jgi:hypothetical protein